MSCSSCNPCYNIQSAFYIDPNTTGCEGSNVISCETVKYIGPNLACSGIQNDDSLCLAIQKLDNIVCNNPAFTVDANNGLAKDLYTNTITLGGPLITPTTITTDATNTLTLAGLQSETTPTFILTRDSNGVIKYSSTSVLSPQINVADNVGLTINTGHDTLSTLYNTLVTDTVTSVQVGGAAPKEASFWKTKNLVEVLDIILFPLQLPTYKIPEILIVGSLPASPVEIGTVQNISFTPTGYRWDAGAFQALRVSRKKYDSGTYAQQILYTNLQGTEGAVFGSQFGFDDPNSKNYTYAPTSAFTQALTIEPVTSGTDVTYYYKVYGTYGRGLKKKTSKNEPDPTAFDVRKTNAPQEQSTDFTLDSDAKTITGIYPYFWGISTNNPDSATPPTSEEIATLINNYNVNNGTLCKKVLESSANTIKINFGNTTSKYLWFAHPDVCDAKQSWYVTTSNRGGIGPGKTFNRIEDKLLHSNPNPYWTGVKYKIYTSLFATFAANDATFEFRNEVSPQ